MMLSPGMVGETRHYCGTQPWSAGGGCGELSPHSFDRVLPLTQKDFGRRDPERVELFEKYSMDTAKAPRPFTTWLNEQAMKEQSGF
jgi:hypothetical protein